MEIERIGVDKLVGHGANANVMDDESMAKLKKHISRHGYYEPLVVRKHPHREGYYELINGHHRQKILRDLGHGEVNCVVWDVDDDEVLLLLATLNRLTGADAPKLRGQLLAKLSSNMAAKELLRNIPEKRQQLEKLLVLNKPGVMIAPEHLGEMPEAMTFFVTAEQKEIIEQSLVQVRQRCKGDDPDEKLKRGDLLTCIAHRYLHEGQNDVE